MHADPQITYKKGYKYQLQVDINLIDEILSGIEYEDQYLRVQNNVLTVKKSYAWDGASGPTIDSPSSIIASIFHDAGYQLIELGVLPKSLKPKIDKWLYSLAVRDGMYKFRAYYWLKAVERFGHPNEGDSNPDIVAP